jgi:hypothetical protein
VWAGISYILAGIVFQCSKHSCTGKSGLECCCCWIDGKIHAGGLDARYDAVSRWSMFSGELNVLDHLRIGDLKMSNARACRAAVL